MYAFSQFFVLSFTRLVTCKSEWSVFHSHDLDADVMRQFDQIIIELHGLLDSEEPPTDNAGYFDEAIGEACATSPSSTWLSSLSFSLSVALSVSLSRSLFPAPPLSQAELARPVVRRRG